MMNANLTNAAQLPCVEQFDGCATTDLWRDDWYLYDYAPKGAEHVRQIHLHFSDRAGQQVKKLVKQYAFWRLGRVKSVTVRLELTGRISHWERYLCARKITDPAQFTAADYGSFLFWLYAGGLRGEHCERILSTIHLLLQTGQRLGWRVTRAELPRQWNSGIRPQRATEECGFARPIPTHIYERIIRHAKTDEKDEITRCGILVQSQTGLRISEVLSLRADCLRRGTDGRWRLRYCLKKTQRGDPVMRETVANAIVCEAVGRLRRATEHLRTESGRMELFLVRNHGIRPPSQANWNRGRLYHFMKRWDIRDENGHIYELHSHQFRATYVTGRLLEGESVASLQEKLGHVTAEMTMHYVHVSEPQMRAYLEPYFGVKEVGR